MTVNATDSGCGGEYEWDEYPEPLWDETASEVQLLILEQCEIWDEER